MNQSLSHIMQNLHGTIVGMLTIYNNKKKYLSNVDVEAIVVTDQPEMTSTSESTGQIIRRKSIKIKDEKCAIYVTFWNNKVKIY
jgi:hypothetical protein